MRNGVEEAGGMTPYPPSPRSTPGPGGFQFVPSAGLFIGGEVSRQSFAIGKRSISSSFLGGGVLSKMNPCCPQGG